MTFSLCTHLFDRSAESWKYEANPEFDNTNHTGMAVLGN